MHTRAFASAALLATLFAACNLSAPPDDDAHSGAGGEAGDSAGAPPHARGGGGAPDTAGGGTPSHAAAAGEGGSPSAGEAGEGGHPAQPPSAGKGGSSTGQGGSGGARAGAPSAGSAGEAGAPPTCTPRPVAVITIAPNTVVADGEALTVSGANRSLTLEFDCSAYQPCRNDRPLNLAAGHVALGYYMGWPAETLAEAITATLTAFEVPAEQSGTSVTLPGSSVSEAVSAEGFEASNAGDCP